MSSFLFAVGHRVCLITVGLLFIYATQYINNPFKKTFKLISYSILFIGCFFGLSILVPKGWLLDNFGIRDLHRSFYYAAMGVMAISSGIILSSFQKAIIITENKFKKAIRELVAFIVKSRENTNNTNNYDKETFDVLENVDTIVKN